jgi:hypothetical protein
MQSLEQALRNLVMQGKVDKAHAEGILQSATGMAGATLGATPGAAAAGAPAR